MQFKKGDYVLTNDSDIGRVSDVYNSECRIWFENDRKDAVIYKDDLSLATGWQGLREGEMIYHSGSEYKVLKRIGDVVLLGKGNIGEGFYAECWYSLEEFENDRFWKRKDQEEEEERKAEAAYKKYKNMYGKQFEIQKKMNQEQEEDLVEKIMDDIDWKLTEYYYPAEAYARMELQKVLQKYLT